MAVSLNDKLVVAISSRALFDLDESNQIFEDEGIEKYICYQIDHENEVLKPGVAFPLIKNLLNIRYPDSDKYAVEVILVSKNDANTGLRIFNSIENFGLQITRAAFTGGKAPYSYLKAFKSDLFLSASSEDVRCALENGYASALIIPGQDALTDLDGEVRIAFDGDAVIFSDEAESVFQSQGLDVFLQSEQEKANIPLTPGPFKPFLEAINKIQKLYANSERKPIRTALVTARNAPSHKRAINTLRHWGVNMDEAFFLGGLDKTPVLEIFKPHIFFDDQVSYCQTASKVVPTGQVIYGIKNAK